MSTTDNTTTIVTEISINAPAARVWEALSDPEHRVRWWTAGGRFKALDMESDLRPGGSWVMRFDSGGNPTSVGGVYRRVEPPRVLETSWAPSWDPNATGTNVRFDLEERDGVTTVRITHAGFANEAARQRHRGWPELLAALRVYAEQSGG